MVKLAKGLGALIAVVVLLVIVVNHFDEPLHDQYNLLVRQDQRVDERFIAAYKFMIGFDSVSGESPEIVGQGIYDSAKKGEFYRRKYVVPIIPRTYPGQGKYLSKSQFSLEEKEIASALQNGQLGLERFAQLLAFSGFGSDLPHSIQNPYVWPVVLDGTGFYLLSVRALLAKGKYGEAAEKLKSVDLFLGNSLTVTHPNTATTILLMSLKSVRSFVEQAQGEYKEFEKIVAKKYSQNFIDTSWRSRLDQNVLFAETKIIDSLVEEVSKFGLTGFSYTDISEASFWRFAISRVMTKVVNLFFQKNKTKNTAFSKINYSLAGLCDSSPALCAVEDFGFNGAAVVNPVGRIFLQVANPGSHSRYKKMRDLAEDIVQRKF